MTRFRLPAVVVLLLLACGSATIAPAADLVKQLRQLDTSVLSNAQRQRANDQVSQWIERERLRAIARENMAWKQVDSRAAWEQFRDPRVDALRDSLGMPFEANQALTVHRTGKHTGEGFVVENLVYESRPGLWVSANLYRPAQPTDSMPGILVSHSHHAPKTQGELQTIGITWARQGCLVLVPDHLGHGERRQHPFVSADDYPGDFRRSRQDYYFRYNVNVQLQSVGESLMGWLVHDLRRGIDLLDMLEGVDHDRTILLGAVAGGGDPAGVTAALDERIEAVIPFNFGGPQPDYAIPPNAEQEFYYFGVAYWEQTRCLPLGGREGFAHWVTVSAAAPRRLVYSCEFGWDRKRDPVWPRIEQVYGYYNGRDQLATAMGKGSLQGRPPENTHCTNVGAYHREQFYPHLARWFDMPIPAREAAPQFEAEELACFTPEVLAKIDRQPARVLAQRLAQRKIATARQQLEKFAPTERRDWLRAEWTKLLGEVEPQAEAKVIEHEASEHDSLQVERIVLEVDDQTIVPLLVLRCTQQNADQRPIVVMITRDGKQGLLDQRCEEIAELLAGGAIICLPDLREMGETRGSTDLSRGSRATTLSCRAQVLGHTMLGARLRDLRSVLAYVQTRDDATGRIGVWGDSLAAVNGPQTSEVVPLGIENPHTFGQPSSGLLALLAGLYDKQIDAIVADGTYQSFGSLLHSPFVYVPHDSIVSGAVATGDVSDLADSLAPGSVQLRNSINGLNRRAGLDREVDLPHWLLQRLTAGGE